MQAIKKTTRRPGRPIAGPDGQNDIREKILDAAEQMFGSYGWTATSFRDIATDVGINPAMITYYFRTKKNLIETVFKRRATQIADRWLQRLDALESRPKRPPTVYELMYSYLSVEFDMQKSGAAGEAFVKLQARIHNEIDDFCFRLRREVYDVATQRYIAAFERALPEVDPVDINWRIVFVIGGFLYMLAGGARLEDLSSGLCKIDDIDEVTARATSFMVGGMSAASTQYSHPHPKTTQPKAAKAKAATTNGKLGRSPKAGKALARKQP